MSAKYDDIESKILKICSKNDYNNVYGRTENHIEDTPPNRGWMKKQSSRLNEVSDELSSAISVKWASRRVALRFISNR